MTGAAVPVPSLHVASLYDCMHVCCSVCSQSMLCGRAWDNAWPAAGQQTAAVLHLPLQAIRDLLVLCCSSRLCWLVQTLGGASV
jgi:hypothetical protein